MSRFKTVGFGFIATTVATLALATGATATASRSITVSFAASSGSSAGWTHHHHAFKLHVAGNPSTAFAVVKLHHFSAKLPKNAPTFDASFYQSGTPRWYIKFANGDYLFGYPDGTWEAHTSTGGFHYGGYSDSVAFVRADSGGTLPNVTKVQIIADGSAPLPYTTIVSNVVYGGHHVTP